MLPAFGQGCDLCRGAYVENGDNTEFIEMLLNTEELKEIKEMYDDSPIITFNEDDTEE